LGKIGPAHAVGESAVGFLDHHAPDIERNRVPIERSPIGQTVGGSPKRTEATRRQGKKQGDQGAAANHAPWIARDLGQWKEISGAKTNVCVMTGHWPLYLSHGYPDTGSACTNPDRSPRLGTWSTHRC